ncbi:DUF2190 family protein [Mesorhizobium sp. B4-1-1]|uniref:DUF2190 family protein n=1 Tax=Mesorhizobium sp. B4-1-1 TaxID=2589890 RepID=UPI00112A56B7|nr:DUF2190 family protein [Mesorhizobium sp. B4-1-1]TPI16577.1 DUF2190 family protein [Mesorhizobium sp. B4-1-1]
MKNYVQAGNVITATAPAGGVTSGGGVQFDALFGVAATDADEGDDFEMACAGVFDLPKAAVSVTYGAKIYWDDDAKVVTTDDGGTSQDNLNIGTALAAASGGTATARVRLRI